jgi:hypothetical protein
MNKTNFNLFSLLKSKYVKTFKTVPLTNKIGTTLFSALTLNNVLSQGRVVRLASRVKLTSNFLYFILKYQKYHGPDATVKWIKAGLVSLQKEIGQDRMKSMIILGIPHHMSLLQRGLPRVIPANCRLLIRRGDVREIRFWTGLFNIYRVLKVSGKIKLETITDPMTNTIYSLVKYLNISKVFNPFTYLESFDSISKRRLAPTKVFQSRSSSPSNRISSYGFLTDLYLLKYRNPKL